MFSVVGGEKGEGGLVSFSMCLMNAAASACKKTTGVV